MTIGKLSEAGLIAIQCLLLPVLLSSRQRCRWEEKEQKDGRRGEKKGGNEGDERVRLKDEKQEGWERREVMWGGGRMMLHSESQKQTAPCCQPACPDCPCPWHFPLVSAKSPGLPLNNSPSSPSSHTLPQQQGESYTPRAKPPGPPESDWDETSSA